MKRGKLRWPFVGLLVGALFWSGSRAVASANAAAAESDVTITRITRDGAELVIEVALTAPVPRVVLESRSRADRGAWKPLAVEYLKQFQAPVHTVRFRIPMSAGMELIRARGDVTTPLPESFYQGTNTFETAGAPSTVALTPFVRGTFDSAEGGAAPPADPREVVESDIWRLDGDRLYFFNQNRGLQLIDVADPDAPAILSTYELAASGEQMYLLNGTHVVLLATSYCYYGADDASRVIVLDVSDAAAPRLVAELPVAGQIVESRLVGTALYVVSSAYQTVVAEDASGAPVQTVEWGNRVSSFDLSDPNHPTPKSRLWVGGYGRSVYATDKFLFVAGPGANSDWNRVNIHVLDIASPDGQMEELASIEAVGQVQDKFKMFLNGDVFAFVTMDWGKVESRLHTVSLADPRRPVPLAELLIKDREQLHATRFAGHLLYAVTFERIDPLWIIDLSDPTQPRKVAELELPGWSTYIHPMGDRLLTVGVDVDRSWRTTLQLFDVADPAKPALLTRLLIGDRWSSSEANYDEKALSVLEDQHLALLPVALSDNESGYRQGIQIVDVERDILRARGFIGEDFSARRATVHRGRVVSVSGLEFMAVDISDRDQPRLTSHLELAWPIERVLLAGDYLLELGSNYPAGPSLHVVRADAPGQVLNHASLPNLSLLGATVQADRLYLLQGRTTEYVWPPAAEPVQKPIGTNAGTLVLSVFDLSQLPQVPLLGRVETTHPFDWLEQFDAFWPKPGVLVWAPAANAGYRGPWFWAVDAARPVRAGDALGRRFAPIWWWGSGTRFIACQVATVSAPAFASLLDLRRPDKPWWSLSEVFSAGTLLYASFETSVWDPDFQPPPRPLQRWDGTRYVTVLETPPKGMWVQRHYLRVLDYADETEPLVREPVNIPGRLIGVAAEGSLLFTHSYRHSQTDWWTYTEQIAASAYDGLAAHWLDGFDLPDQWPHPVLAHKGYVLVGRPSSSTNGDAERPPTTTPPALQVWTISSEGKFELVREINLAADAQSLDRLNELLAVTSSGRLDFYLGADPSALRLLGGAASCFWYDNVRSGDGTAERGVWLPTGGYSVQHIPFNPAAAP